jgi:hypothetical protein
VNEVHGVSRVIVVGVEVEVLIGRVDVHGQFPFQ